MIPHDAEEIAAMRLAGMKPADAVVISTIGHFDSDQFVVRVHPERIYDWHWVKGLDLMVLVRKDSKPVARLLRALFDAGADRVFLCDETKRKAFFLFPLLTSKTRKGNWNWKPTLVPCTPEQNRGIFQ